MQKKVFLSYAADDRRYKNKIFKWHSQGKLGDKVSIYTLDDNEFWDEQDNLLEEQLMQVMRKVDLVVVIAGDSNEDHPWLDWEGEFCHQWGINRVLMRIPYTTGPLPREFEVLREIAFNPNAIEKEMRDATATPGLY